MSSGTGCWIISLKNFSLISILLSHSEDWSVLRSFHQNSVRSAITVFTAVAYLYSAPWGRSRPHLSLRCGW